MTFRELREFLDTLDEGQLDCDVTVGVVAQGSESDKDRDDQELFLRTAEFYACDIWGATIDCDILDNGHPYLGIVTDQGN